MMSAGVSKSVKVPCASCLLPVLSYQFFVIYYTEINKISFIWDVSCCHDLSYSTIALVYSMGHPKVANLASKMAPIRSFFHENGLK